MINKKTSLSIKKLLSHPLLLLIIGAVISGLLVPYITNQWQNHQKEMEIKTNLVTQISKAVSNIIIVSRIVQLPSFSYTNLSYATTFEDWEVSKSTIGSQLQAYFSQNNIRQEWDNLSVAITDFSGLSPQLSAKDTSKSDYSVKICARMIHILNLHQYLQPDYPININDTDMNIHSCQDVDQQKIKTYSSNIDGINWRVLLYKDKYSSSIYFKNWLMLEKDLQGQKDNLIKTILDTSILNF